MKRWLYTVGFAGLIAILLIPLMGFSANAKGQTKISPNQITLESGGIGVPYTKIPDAPPIYHQPVDGIISGAAGCVPDLHEFYKSNPEENIVFTAGVEEFTSDKDVSSFLDDFTIYVEITSNGQKVVELPFYYHGEDPNTGNPFWVSALYLSEANLPTGDYNYKFKVKANGKNGHVLDVWVPKNHKFTIVD